MGPAMKGADTVSHQPAASNETAAHSAAPNPAAPDPTQLAAKHFREVLGQYPTGVTAITALDPAGEPIAMVVGTFSSVSLDPPLVSFMPTRTSGSYARLMEAETLCANVLAMDQEPLCRQLARPGGMEKFEGVSWSSSPGGAPIIEGAAAWVEFTVQQRIEAGDHDIVLGLVSHLDTGDGGLPLLFLGGGYGRYTAHSRIMATTVDTLQYVTWAEKAKPVLERFSDSMGLEVVLVACIDDRIVQVASYGTVLPGARPHPLGLRLPFGAPMGALIIAAAGEQSRRNWVRATDPDLGEAQIQAHLAALDRVRERGWVVNLMSTGFRALDSSLRAAGKAGELSWDAVPPAAELTMPEAYAAELPGDPGELVSVRNVSVAVKGSAGAPLCYLTLFGFDELSPSGFVRQAVEQLGDVAGTVADLLSSSE